MTKKRNLKSKYKKYLKPKKVRRTKKRLEIGTFKADRIQTKEQAIRAAKAIDAFLRSQ